MILVVEASVLITLARIGRLALLRRLAREVYLPDAVFDEVVQKGTGRPGSAEIGQATWLLRRAVRDRRAVARLSGRVGRGEAEAIVLAKELAADFVVIDDAQGKRAADAEGQPVVGLVGLLVHAKHRGVISHIKPLLDDMLAAGFFLDDARYRSILQLAQE